MFTFERAAFHAVDMKPAGRQTIATPNGLQQLVHATIERYTGSDDIDLTPWLVAPEASLEVTPDPHLQTLPVRIQLKRKEDDWQAMTLFRRTQQFGCAYDIYTERFASIAGQFGCQALVHTISMNSFLRGYEYFGWMEDLNRKPNIASVRLASYLGEFGLSRASENTTRLPRRSIVARLAQARFTGSDPREV
jgi:hypothetical protein